MTIFVFSLRGAAFRYKGAPVDALRDVSIDISEGEWTTLLGANGSGKSTLAKICSALLLPTQGDCFVMGADSKDEAAMERNRGRVALVFQNPDDQIVAAIVEEDVAFGPENLALPADEIRRRVDSALRIVGLYEERKRSSFSLSGGQKQRLALAGALALEPDALIIDEATSMLDPEGRLSFLSCLESLRKSGMTILQITHRMEEAIHADRVIVMDHGSAVWDGSPSEFFDERGEYLKRGFEEPPEFRLRRELVLRDFLPRDTRAEADEMLGSLCL
jgi:energy-coupling factor transport system ATP-binding protein